MVAVEEAMHEAVKHRLVLCIGALIEPSQCNCETFVMHQSHGHCTTRTICDRTVPKPLQFFNAAVKKTHPLAQVQAIQVQATRA